MLGEGTAIGFNVMGDIPWGTHFCYIYETLADLMETCVAYFQAGLEHHEFCLWSVYTPISEADAVAILRQSIPDFDRHLAEGAIEIIVHPDGEISEPKETIGYLHQKLEDALARGYTGMRVAGSPACLQKASEDYFSQFEQQLGTAAANRRMIAFCYFALAESSAPEILDAARSHRFVLARRQGDWEIIETPESRLAQAQMAKLNAELERRVEERTRALESVNEELRNEIARRERVEEDLRQQKEILQTIFDHVPVILKFVDKSGRPQMINREWERVLGRSRDDLGASANILEEEYPDPVERQRVLDFVANSNAEWVDFKTRVKDGRFIDTSWAVVRLSDGSSICIGQNITERKQAEQELRKQKEILQTIFDNIPLMISFGDLELDLRLVNHEWEKTVGWTLEEIRRNNIDIFAENYPDPVYRREVLDFVRNSQGEWADFKTRVRDGRIIDTSWVALHLPDGTRIGIGQDITERKRAEEALRESEERFRQLAENINDLFWIKSADFNRVLYLSPVYKKVSGRSPEDRYQDKDSQRFLERIVPEDREKMEEIIRKGADKEFDVEFRIKHPDGSVRWIQERGFPIRDRSGQIYRVAGIASDITERKLAEQALRESEERFRQLAENIREVFWMTTPDFAHVLYLSPRFEELFGIARESRYPGPESKSYLDLVYPEDRPVIIEQMKAPGQVFDLEYRILRPDGSTRWIRDRGFPIRDSSGAVCRIGGVAEDVTERREAEDRLKANNEQMRALSANLQSAREKEATRIAHQIHDEMGGILTALRWEIEALQKMVDQPANPPESRSANPAELKTAMRSKLATMVGLTDTTINVVRRIASELRPSILDDLGLLEAIEWQADQFQARTGIQCRCDYDVQHIRMTDEQSTALFRIVQEALTNILRHAKATWVEISVSQENGALLLTVSDNGRGITESEKVSRNSLGLLGMQERAHLIGGRFEILSRKPRGTKLEVSVPLSSAAAGSKS